MLRRRSSGPAGAHRARRHTAPSKVSPRRTKKEAAQQSESPWPISRSEVRKRFSAWERSGRSAAPKDKKTSPSRIILRMVLTLAVLFLGSTYLTVALFGWVAPPFTSFMLQRSVAAWLQSGRWESPRYQWKRYEEISPDLALAFVAAEDQKFMRHEGFDFDAIREARKAYEAGGKLRGASTISQQLAKNLFLWPGRSYFRKVLEAYFTMIMEGLWTKKRILEVYMNTVELGDLVFGVEAASRRFFARSARQVGPGNAALLAAVLPNPHLYRVDEPSAYVLERRRKILSQMNHLGAGYLNSLRHQ